MLPEFTINIGFYIVFLLSVTAHEAAHAWAGWKLGDDTAYLGGQVTLDPMPHIRREPIGMVVVPIVALISIGFPIGYASAPYNPLWAQRYPKRAAWMALAGPGANLILAALALGLARIGLETEVFAKAETVKYTNLVDSTGTFVSNSGSLFLSLLAFMNILLLVFNLIPFPPLDGSAALPLFLPRAAMESVRNFYAQPWAPMVGIVIAWLTIGELMNAVWWPVINTMYSGIARYG